MTDAEEPAPSGPPPVDGTHYAQLVAPEYGFLLAVALTMVASVAAALVAKVWLTLRPSKRTSSVGTARHAFLVADVVWGLAHVVAFVYFGLRISTMHALTTIGQVPEAERPSLAHRSLACQAMFLITQYASSAYVLCAVLAVPTVAKRHSAWQNSAYLTTAGCLVFGCLVSTLPWIGCNSLFLFGDSSKCPNANARIFPPLIISMLLDLGLIVRWLTFVRSRTYSNSGRQGSKISLPIAAFLLRLLIVGADAAYLVLYVGFHAGRNPYHYLAYAETIAVGTTLLASSAISLSRTLGKFNFGTLAYAVKEGAGTQDYGLSSMGAGRSRDRGEPAQTGTSAAAASSATAQGAGTRLGGWKSLASTLKNNVAGGGRRDSGSEEDILQDGIYRKIEVSQEIGRSGTASTASKRDLTETHAV